MKSKNGKSLLLILVIVIIGLWLLTGIYTVNDTGGEQAVLVRFGQYVKTEIEAGLHWHLPAPIENVYKEKVKEIRTIELGFRTIKAGSTTQAGQYRNVPEESLMLTSDEAMLDVETIVQYKISNLKNYLFKVDDQFETIKIAAEAVVRRVIASHISDEALTTNKSGIQLEIQDEIQTISDNYELGIMIETVKLQDVSPPEEVQDSFRDVVNAREDKNSFINEAQEFENEITPKARGNAAEMINQAEGYKARRIAEAEGDVAKFVAILEEYKKAEDITRTRLYIEMLEEVLPNMTKFIVNEESGSGILKFLPLTNAGDSIPEINQNGGTSNE